MEALALAELVLRLPGALFGLLQAADGVGRFPITEVDVPQVEVRPVKILQQLALPSQDDRQEG